MSTSLNSRIRVSGPKVEVIADPDRPNNRLYYRVVNLYQSASSTNEFQEALYPFQYDLKNGQVLELKEGEEVSLQYLDVHKKLKMKQVQCHGFLQISFLANSDLHLSRIQLEDPQKRRYSLGTAGVINEKDRWYLPDDAVFSKNPNKTCWHVLLDRYSECLFELSFDD